MHIFLASLLTVALSPAATAATTAATTSVAAPASVRDYLESNGYRTFKLTKLPTGHETIEVTINGKTGIFVVDSGAGATVVHNDRKAKFDLDAAAIAHSSGAGAGGSIAISGHPISSFAISGKPVPLKQVMATNLDSVVSRLKAVTGVEVDGVVGQDVLSGFAAIINIGASELYLKLPNPAPAGA